MKSIPAFLLFVCLVLPALRAQGGSLPESNAQGMEFFEKKVRPILEARCAECHSARKKIKGGLDLDSKAGWMKGGDTGPAIVPGDAGNSLLISAVHWAEKELQMPPKKKLSSAEIGVLEEWVAMGAPDPRSAAAEGVAAKSKAMSLEEGRRFWSYAPRQPVQVPPVRRNDWALTDIDRFILAKLEEKGVEPSPLASPAELTRRLALVLTGLPPTPEQIQELERQGAAEGLAKAAEAFADSLLSSPQFGETWGRHWLDVARFAESSGGGRTLLFKDAWRYRDYVIEAFNQDRPFDQFLREQVAGDLLPAPTPELRARQLTATGFLALGPTIYEEQDKQKLRFDVIDEQLDTIGKGILGQTIGCARCHDHKFDPIPQRDYYALAGIFASTRTLSSYEANVASWILTDLPVDEESAARIDAQQTRIEAAEKALQGKKNRLADLKKAKAGIAVEAGGERRRKPEPLKLGVPLPLSVLAGVALDDGDATAVGPWKRSKFCSQYFGEGYLHDENKEKGAKSLTFTPRLPRSGRYEVRLSFPSLSDRAKRVPVHIFHSKGDTTVYVDQSVVPPIEGRFVSLGVYEFESSGEGYVIISNEGTEGFVCVDALQFLPEGSSDVVEDRQAGKARKAHPQDAIAALTAEIKADEAALAAQKARQEKRPAVMSVREEDQIEDTHIRIRGEVNQRGAKVARGFLRVLGDSGEGRFDLKQSGRMALADWLASAENPLTARVYVNRVWAWMFGTGLVRTVDNFATTGEAPSHPELLDYLAQYFVEHQWSTKALIRQIVRSRVWLGSVGEPGAVERDPENRWFGRANRRRLDAEQIRDGMLAVSGLLDSRVGGPNIEGANAADPLSGEASRVEFEYVFRDVRRSVYTPAFRNNRLELFATFDFGDTNTSQGQRYASNVAPQALFFLNHPFVLEQARRAARNEPLVAGTQTGRVRLAFVRCLGRAPTAGEASVCARHLAEAESGEEAQREAWSRIYQSLFGSADFRFLN
ncbi:MAG: hypothetical protein RLZZ142_170 [Verrucomicrobiota bacterium]